MKRNTLSAVMDIVGAFCMIVGAYGLSRCRGYKNIERAVMLSGVVGPEKIRILEAAKKWF